MPLERVNFVVTADEVREGEATRRANDKLLSREEALRPYRLHDERPVFYQALALEAMPRPEWLIEWMVPKGDQVMVAAAEATGKTSLLFEWAWHIASGRREWHGYELHPERDRPVLYVVTEGFTQPGGIARGVKRMYGGTYPDNLHLSLDPVKVGRDHHLDQEVLDAWVAQVAKRNYQLIVVDTLNRTAGGLEENSSGDMAEYIRFWETLQNAVANNHAGTRPTLIVTHHVTKDSGSPRGSSALAASVDTIMALTLDKATNPPMTDVTCIKQKAAKAFRPWRFSLDWEDDQDPVIGNVTDGEVSSLVAKAEIRKGKVHQYVLENPGASKNSMKDDLAMGWKTVVNHLAELVSEGKVEERYDGWYAT